MPEFNQGTLPYELIVRSNTIISNLGVFDLKMKIRAVQPQMVDFSEISEHLNSCVRKYLHMYICLLYLHMYTHGYIIRNRIIYECVRAYVRMCVCLRLYINSVYYHTLHIKYIYSYIFTIILYYDFIISYYLIIVIYLQI